MYSIKTYKETADYRCNSNWNQKEENLWNPYNFELSDHFFMFWTIFYELGFKRGNIA